MSDNTRPRYGGSKTRTGCKTCKARHVKCDEGKPTCQRCMKAGRKCEGYSPPRSRTRSPHSELRIIHYVATPPREMSPNSEATWKEKRALAFFRERTAFELNGPFSSQVWTHSMLTLANYHPSVRHALIALGSAHEEFANRPTLMHQVSDFSLEHYGKAISLVLEMNRPQSPDTTEIVLATCLIFSMLEIMRGFVQSSISHITSGMRLLEEEESRQGSPHEGCLSQDALHQLFMRLDAQMMEIGGETFLPGSFLSRMRPLSMPDTFQSIAEAAHHFEHLLDNCMQLSRRAGQAYLTSDSAPEVLEPFKYEQYGLEAARQQWEQAFRNYLNRSSPVDDAGASTQEAARLALEINHEALRIMLNVDMIDPESEFDDWLDTWTKIVDDTETYLALTSTLRSPEQAPATAFSPSSATTSSRSSQSPSSSAAIAPTAIFPVRSNPETASTPTPNPSSTSTSFLLRNLSPRPAPTPIPAFSLSLGIVMPLYLTISRCRDPKIRHRGLFLLETCNRREGLWDSRLAAKVVSQQVAIEERTAFRDINMDDLSRASQMGSGAALVRPEHRIKAVNVEFGAEADAVARYSYRYPGTEGGRCWKGDGKKGDGSWVETMEFRELTRWS